MEIPDVNVRISLNLAARSSAMELLRRRRDPGEPLERARSAQAELSRLLFGIDVAMQELQHYRMRLLETVDRLNRFEEDDPDLPDPRLGPGGPGGGYQVGRMVWTPAPGPAPAPAVAIGEAHRAHAARLVEMHNLCRACGTATRPHEPCSSCGTPPREAVARLGIIVGCGREGYVAGEDLVELTPHGLTEIQAPVPGEVLFSRMPPQFPRYGEVLRRVVA